MLGNLKDLIKTQNYSFLNNKLSPLQGLDLGSPDVPPII